MTEPIDARLVAKARAGDPAALHRLMAGHLPLLYTVIRWATVRRDDVDDIVRNTLTRVVVGIDRLPDPDHFRSWLVTIASEEIGAYNRTGVFPVSDFWEQPDITDSGANFAAPSATELGLSSWPAEVVLATRWLDPGDRQSLSLWWPFRSGHLTRADIDTALQRNALDLDAHFDRLAANLESARLIVGALMASPRCPALSAIIVLGQWRGEHTPQWRERFTDHIAGCTQCGVGVDKLPADALLCGLPLLPVPNGYTAFMLSSAHSAATRRISGPGGRADGKHRSGRGGTLARAARLASRPSIAVVVLVAGGTTGVAALYAATTSSAITSSATSSTNTSTDGSGPSSSPAVAAHMPTPSTAVSPSPPKKPLNTATRPTHPSVASTSHPTASSPTLPATSETDSVDSNAVRQTLDLINHARAQAGLPPYTVSASLTTSAAAHDRLMIDGCGLNHQCPGEPDIGPRGAAGENIGVGGTAVSLTQLMLAEKAPNDGHRQNILNKGFKHVGIAVYRDSHGTVWMTQDFS